MNLTSRQGCAMESKLPKDHGQEMEQMRQDFRDHNESDPEAQNATLLEAVTAMEENSIPYALIGGIAGKGLGRPRITHDIDLFLTPEDANYALEVLDERGFKTEKRDPAWLYKAWKNGILVDIIFRSSGDIYFDEEIQRHVRRVPFKNHYLNSISPEDFIVIKAAVHQEHIPHHWHDALAVLTEGNLDWEYLVKRSRYSPRRVLALLIYAQSNDIAVPIEAVQTLYRKLYEMSSQVPRPVIHPYRKAEPTSQTSNGPRDSIVYIKARIMEALSTDERTADHDIKVMVTESEINVRGEVFTEDQRRAVHEVIRTVSPEREFKNQIYVRSLPGPEESEVIQ